MEACGWAPKAAASSITITEFSARTDRAMASRRICTQRDGRRDGPAVDRHGQRSVREQHGVVQRVDTTRVAPSLAIHSIFEDREHRIWVGGSRLLRFAGNEVRSSTCRAPSARTG